MTEMCYKITEPEGAMTALDPQHALEALGPAIARLFLKHSEPLSVEEAWELVPLVDVHLEATHTVRTSMSTMINVRMAEQLVTACKALLALYPDLDEKGRSAVVGAVRYFMQARDAEADLESESGFEDDALVVNYVIDLTGADIEPVRID
jgi:uncharacterized membrane protein YkvA (DUF1232 family)